MKIIHFKISQDGDTLYIQRKDGRFAEVTTTQLIDYVLGIHWPKIGVNKIALHSPIDRMIAFKTEGVECDMMSYGRFLAEEDHNILIYLEGLSQSRSLVWIALSVDKVAA